MFHSSNSIFHPPSWKRISDSLYVYSAFCSKLPGSIEICPSITILALSKTPDEQLEKLNCQLWYGINILYVMYFFYVKSFPERHLSE